MVQMLQAFVAYVIILLNFDPKFLFFIFFVLSTTKRTTFKAKLFIQKDTRWSLLSLYGYLT